jgi:Tfp pilus assembly protein PilF
VAEKLPFVALGVVFMFVAGLAAHSAPHAMKTLEEWPIPARIGQAAYGLVFYLWKSVAPTNLAIVYQLPQPMDPLAGKFLLCYGLVLGGAAAVLVLARRLPALACAAIIYAAMLAPVLGFFQSGEQFVADRYSYVSCIGWSIVVGAGVARALASKRVSLVQGLIGAGVVLGLLAVLTFNQAATWRTPLTLWQQAVRAGAANSTVHVNYGINLEAAKRDPEAIEQFTIATGLPPFDAKAWISLGNALQKAKRFDEAEKAYLEAAKVPPARYMALVNRGAMYLMELHRTTEGVALLREAATDMERPAVGELARRQPSGRAHLALAAALAATGDPEGAKAAYRKAAEFGNTREEATRKLRELGDRP